MDFLPPELACQVNTSKLEKILVNQHTWNGLSLVIPSNTPTDSNITSPANSASSSTSTTPTSCPTNGHLIQTMQANLQSLTQNQLSSSKPNPPTISSSNSTPPATPPSLRFSGSSSSFHSRTEANIPYSHLSSSNSQLIISSAQTSNSNFHGNSQSFNIPIEALIKTENSTPSTFEELYQHQLALQSNSSHGGQVESKSNEVLGQIIAKRNINEEYVDVSPYVTFPQHEAAKRLGMPSSILSKKMERRDCK